MLYLPYEKKSKRSTFLVLDSMACPPAAVTAPRNWGISAAAIAPFSSNYSTTSTVQTLKLGCPRNFMEICKMSLKCQAWHSTVYYQTFLANIVNLLTFIASFWVEMES